MRFEKLNNAVHMIEVTYYRKSLKARSLGMQLMIQEHRIVQSHLDIHDLICHRHHNLFLSILIQHDCTKHQHRQTSNLVLGILKNM